MAKKNKIKSDFKKGDVVNIIDTGNVYKNYSQFITAHPKYMLRWVYKEYPNTDHRFKVRGVYKHVLKNSYDKNSTCVVISDIITGQIYLIGEHGIIKSSELNSSLSRGNVIKSDATKKRRFLFWK